MDRLYSNVYTENGKYYLYISDGEYLEVTDAQEVVDIENEIAAIQAEVDAKQDAIPGKGLSTEDYTTADKETVGNITSTLGLTYNDLDTGKQTYTNIDLAGKQVTLISNQTNNYPVLSFDQNGVLNLGFTATSGFAGVLLGSLGTAPNADEFIAFLKTIITETGDNSIKIVDALRYIGLIFDSNGLKTYQILSKFLQLGSNVVMFEGENLFAIKDINGFYALRYTTQGKLFIRDINLEIGSPSSIKGKNVVLVANSISVPVRMDGSTVIWNAEQVWHAVMAATYGCNIYGLSAIGGTSTGGTTAGGNQPYWTRITPLLDSLDTSLVDAFIIGDCTNDFGGRKINIGTINDTTTDTLYGAYNYMIPLIASRCPKAKIFIITPMQRDFNGTDGFPAARAAGSGYLAGALTDFRQASINAAQKWNCKIIDWWTKSVINPTNLNPALVPPLTQDGLHPLVYGQNDLGIVTGKELELYF